MIDSYCELPYYDANTKNLIDCLIIRVCRKTSSRYEMNDEINKRDSKHSL